MERNRVFHAQKSRPGLRCEPRARELQQQASFGLLDKLVRAERFREPITSMTADRLDSFALRIFVVEDDNDSLSAIQIYLEK